MIRRSKCPVMLLFYLLIALFNHWLGVVADNVSSFLKVQNVTLWPGRLSQLNEGTSQDVQYSMYAQLDGGKLFSEIANRSYGSEFNSSNHHFLLCYRPEDPAVAWASSSSNHSQQSFCTGYSLRDPNNVLSSSGTRQIYLVNGSFSVKGLFIGKTNIIIELFQDSTDGRLNMSKDIKNYEVSVIRGNKRLQHIFVGTLSILLVVANVLLGAQMRLDVVWQVIKKPFAPAVGFVCQYLFMPLISFALSEMLFMPVGLNTLALGLFTSGCSPPGGASNGYTLLLDGNVDLSVTMTFLSTMAALVIMPVWMFTLGRRFLDISTKDQFINIPYDRICISLITLVLPLIVGALIRHFRRGLAEKANKFLRPLLLLIIAFICTFGVYANIYMFRLMTWRVLLAGGCLPVLGFSIGFIAATILRQPTPNVTAIAIETAIQNTGISIFLLQLSFDQPDADLASVVPVVVAMFTPPPMLFALAIHYFLKWKHQAKKLLEQKQMADLSSTFDNVVAFSSEIVVERRRQAACFNGGKNYQSNGDGTKTNVKTDSMLPLCETVEGV